MFIGYAGSLISWTWQNSRRERERKKNDEVILIQKKEEEEENDEKLFYSLSNNLRCIHEMI